MLLLNRLAILMSIWVTIFTLYSKTTQAEGRLIDLSDFVDRSSLVLRVSAVEVDPLSFDVQTGQAMTRVTFRILETLYGKYNKELIEFHIRGGFLPNGNYSSWSDVPYIAKGFDYLIFVKNKEWVFSPFVNDADGIFRETYYNNEVVYVSDAGELIETIGELGLRVTHAVSEPSSVLHFENLGWSVERKDNIAQAGSSAVGKSQKRNSVLAQVRVVAEKKKNNRSKLQSQTNSTESKDAPDAEPVYYYPVKLHHSLMPN